VDGLAASPRGGDLVERETERAAIGEVVADARRGSGRLLVIEGPAGIGKTRLLQAARDEAVTAGLGVLSASGSELEREYPFGLVKQCLALIVRRPEDRARLLTGAAQRAEAALFDTDVRGDVSAFGLLDGLYWLVVGVAEERPSLLLIDDAHWADEPSLRFLAYLARRLDGIPLSVAIAARAQMDFSAGPPVLEAVREFARSRGALLEPSPLDVAGVARFLEVACEGQVDERFARACHEVTGGNPFLLDALVCSLVEAGVPLVGAAAQRVAEVYPPAVQRWVTATLHRVSEPAQSLAQAVAVLGDGTTVELAAKLGAIAAPAATAAVSELVHVGLLADGVPLRFRHPLLGSAVRESLPAAERAEAHARAVGLLRAGGAGPERVAPQLLHVSPSGDAAVVGELRSAAEHARDRGAPATALVLLRRALEEPPPTSDAATVMIEVARVELDEGRPSVAREHLLAAFLEASDPRVRARAASMIVAAVPGDEAARREATQLAERALADLGDDDRELALRLQASLVMQGKDITVAPDTLTGDTLAEAVLLGHTVFARMGPGARATDVAELARRGARQIDGLVEEGAIGLAFTGIVLALRWTDQLEIAEDLLGRAIDVSRRRGSRSDFAMAMTQRATVFRRAGRLRDAEADARVALAINMEEPWTFARGIAPLVGVLLDQGDADEATAQLHALVADDGEVADAPPMTPVLLARMAVQAARGEPERALATWQEARRRATRLRGGLAPSWIEDLSLVADVYQAYGDNAGARDAADEARELAEAWGTPGARGQALHAQARVKALTDPVAALREAVTLLEASPARLEHARALITLGGVLRRAGHRVDSRGPLRDGYELAVTCGARQLADTARAELRASGVRVQRTQRDGPAHLTASELRIATLASEGLSNGEIAQELFLTVKTVEMHLTHTYRKLDIGGRGQLAAVLGPQV
jgi:ATP/maltotriose-dependent transcriptional regulator MalT